MRPNAGSAGSRPRCPNRGFPARRSWRDRSGARERQRARGSIEVSGDAALVREREEVMALHVTGSDVQPGADEVGGVAVRDVHVRAYQNWGAVLDVSGTAKTVPENRTTGH